MSVSSPNSAQVDVGNVSCREALEKVCTLCQTPVPVDPHPNVHVGPVGLEYIADHDSKFHDGSVYVVALSKFLEEAAQLAEMIELMETGEKFSCVLYTWRSCSLALPQSTQLEHYQMAVEVLEPEIQKLKDFMSFQKVAVSRFQKEVTALCSSTNKGKFVTEARLLTIGRFIGMLATLDELKNTKASVINDYAYYKRAVERSRRDPGSVTQMQEMSMFLATNNVILGQVKACLSEIAGFEDVLCNVINTCVSWYEQRQYLLPEEKYGLVKAIGYSLYLVDSDKININKLHGRKKINLSKVDAIFKEVEVVPLFGDLMIGPFMYIKKTPNYTPANWEKCMSLDAVSRQSQLLPLMTSYRKQHADIVSEFMIVARPPDVSQFTVRRKRNTSSLDDIDRLSGDQCARTYQVTEKCLQTLSTWTTNISELFSWKLLHPAEPSDRPDGCPVTSETYERATRYNYSSAEKSALVELIGLIKSLQSLVQRHEAFLQRVINVHIYKTLQEFVREHLSEPLRKAVKHQKNVISSTLSAVQKVVLNEVSNKNNNNNAHPPPPPSSATGGDTVSTLKPIPPSTTQLFLVRMMLESLVSKSDGSQKCLRKDIDPAHVRIIETFLQISFAWPYFMNLHKSLQSCCDLSQLWYREFYLEMTKGERIQFPIEMSFPWILADHVLEKRDPYLVQYILYPLDLYNDSAQCALRTFRKQFLYDEIEAEVKLCFDQFVYKLSEHIYEHYKIMAGSAYLNKMFKSECKKLGVQFPAAGPSTNYVPFMQQQNVQLLGRTVDLRHLISQRINDQLLRSLKAVIGRFEASDITGIVELEGLVRVNHDVHRLLSQHLVLDEFQDLLSEANHCVSAPWGRIPLYILVDLDQFFMPHFCYNASTNRFVRTVFSFADDVTRDKPSTVAPYHLWGSKNLNQYFAAIYSRYRNFIGPPHFNAMCSLLSYQDVALLLNELLEIIKNTIAKTLLPYLRVLQNVMPKRCILPRYEYTSPGVLGYFQLQLQDIMAYADLKPKVFQCLREIGNGILFAIQIENALSLKEVSELTLSAMFRNILPKPFIKTARSGVMKQPTEEQLKQEDAERRKVQQQLETKYRNQNIAAVISAKGSEEQVRLCQANVLLSREKLCSGLILFHSFLTRLGDLLKSDPLWTTLSTSDGVWNVENNIEFHRVWSAMQFVFCRPPGPNEYTIEELFGEGLNWAGCTFVVLLGQQRRYEAMDFCGHLHKIHKVDQMEKLEATISLRKMVERIRRFQTLHDNIMMCLNKHLNISPSFTISSSPASLTTPSVSSTPSLSTTPTTPSLTPMTLRTTTTVKNAYAVHIEHFLPPAFDPYAPRSPAASPSAAGGVISCDSLEQ